MIYTVSNTTELLSAKSSSIAGDTIILRGGRYELTTPLNFDSSDSGVTWKAYAGEKTVISGGIQIVGWSQVGTSNVYSAAIPSTGSFAKMIFVNGVRSATTSPALQNVSVNGTTGRITFSSTLIPNALTNLDRLLWTFKLLPLPWAYHTSPIDPVTYTFNNGIHSFIPIGARAFLYCIKQEWWGGYVYDGGYGQGCQLLNVQQALIQQGQAYVDIANHIAYYIPTTDENIGNAEVILPTLEQVVIVNGTINSLFQGLTFAHTAWYEPETYDTVEFQANYYTHAQDYVNQIGDHDGGAYQDEPLDTSLRIMPAGIGLSNSSNITFESCKIAHMGGRGISFDEGASYCTLKNSEITDISCTGVSVGLTTSSQDSGVNNNFITKNLIHKVAIEYYGGLGIFLGWTAQCKVLQNTITDVPYTGISLGWGWGRHGDAYSNTNEIAYNKVYNIMGYGSSDGGSIYTLGVQTDSLIHDNYIYSDPTFYTSLGLETDSSNCVYLDEGTTGIQVNNNVCVKPPSHWLGGQPGVSAADNNYILDGLYIQTPYLDAVTVTNTITLSSTDQSTWPTEAQAIANNAGVFLVGEEIHWLDNGIEHWLDNGIERWIDAYGIEHWLDNGIERWIDAYGIEHWLDNGIERWIDAYGIEHWLDNGIERWIDAYGIEHWLDNGIERWIDAYGITHFSASTLVTPSGGSCSGDQTVTLATEGYQIYYTTDGTIPSILVGDDGKALFDDTGLAIIMDGE